MANRKGSALVLSSMDPEADSRCMWIAEAISDADFDVRLHGFVADAPVDGHRIIDGNKVLYSTPSSEAMPVEAFRELLRKTGSLPERIFSRAAALEAIMPSLQEAEAAGTAGPASPGLSAYHWFYFDHAELQARTVLARLLEEKNPPDVVIAADSITLLAALGLKAQFGCRIIYDVQSFGADHLLVHSRPRSAYHMFERVALRKIDGISAPTNEPIEKMRARYRELPPVAVTEQKTRPRRLVSLLSENPEGANKLLILCGHEPTVDPRIGWTADAAAGEGFETRIMGWTDGYGVPRATDPEGVEVMRYGPDAPAISSWQMWQLVFKHNLLPLSLIVLGLLNAFFSGLVFVASRPWAALRWLTHTLRIAAFTTGPIDRLGGLLLYHVWNKHVEPRLPGRGLKAYHWYVFDYAFEEARRVLKQVEMSGWVPGIIHANDPDTLLAGAAVRALHGSRLIYDAHEFGPDAYLMNTKPRKLFEDYEAKLFTHADGAVTVSEAIASRFNRRHGAALKFHTIPNASPTEDPPKFIDLMDVQAVTKGRMRFLFQGGIARHRGIGQVIEEWKSVDDSKAVLFIRGPENAYRKELIEKARATGRLDSSIFFVPSIGEDDLIAAARHADVGLIPYRSHVENHSGASPNKLSQYMQAGAAILSANLPTVAPIIKAGECGRTYDDTRPGALSDAINAMAKDPDTISQYGASGRDFASGWYNFQVFAPTLMSLYEGRRPKPNASLEVFRQISETGRISPKSDKVEFIRKAAQSLDRLPEIASDYLARHEPAARPPYEEEYIKSVGGKRQRGFRIPALPTRDDTRLEQSLVESLAPANPDQKSVLFLHQSYYHFFHLAAALRERGFHAQLVSFESPDSANAPFYHGEDLNLWHEQASVRKARAYDLLEAVAQHFKVIHFHGAELASLFEVNYQPPARDDVPWDLLELKRRGVKIGHSISGCNTGQRPSLLYKASDGVCDKCIWQLHPEVCGDPQMGAQNTMLESLLDLNAIEVDWPADTSRHTKGSYYDPLTYCVDTQMWAPNIDVPDEMKFEREPGEILIFHAVGNFDKRAKSDRNIKGSGAVIAAVERLQAEGYPARLVFKTGVPSKDMKFYQVQADIVVDQLNYGRYGASARECMALGLPVISRFIPEQPEGVPTSRALEECPLIHADETTVYDVLKDLLDHPEKRQAAAEASRKYVMKWHSKDSCAARYEIVYDRMMSGLPVYEPMR